MRSGLTSVVMVLGVMLAMAQAAAAQGGATPEASPSASPVAGGDWNLEAAAGTAFDLLVPAPEGTVGVVAVGGVEDGFMPVVIHNATGEAVASVRVEAVVFAGDGELYAVGGAALVSPGRIEPQGIGMGSVSFDDLVFPTGATIETLVTYESPVEDDAFGSLAPEIIESNWAQGRILGVLGNPHDQKITDPRVTVACIAGDGSVQALSTTMTNADVLPVGGAVAFQVMFAGPPCAGELIVADGRR